MRYFSVHTVQKVPNQLNYSTNERFYSLLTVNRTPMSLHFYQIIIVGLAGFMIWQGGVQYFRQEGGQTFFKFSIRLIVWGGMAAIALFPTLSNDLATLIGIEGNINAVIMVGFILVFLMIFKLLSAIERVERQITSLTRREALDGIDKKTTQQ